MKIIFWLLAILISVAAGYWVYKTDRKKAVPYPWLTALLRSCIIFFTCLLLLAPFISVEKNETQKPVILFLQDNSESVADALKNDSVFFRKNATELLDKLSGKYQIVKWGFGNTIQKDTLFQYQQQVTDISNALTQAVDYYRQQNLGAIILATDGRYNQGINPQFMEVPFQGSIYTAVIGDTSSQKDLKITQTYANKTVLLNSQFEIRADIVAARCEGYNHAVSIKEVGGNVMGSSPINISSEQFDKAVAFVLKAERIGLHHYVITAPAADGEANIYNNRKDVFVEVVSEKKNILLLAAAPHPDVNTIREALNGLDNYNLTIKITKTIPADLSAFQVVILHNLPIDNQNITNNKPVWLIVGNGTNIAAINQTQLAKLSVNSLNLSNNFAQYNQSFNTFTLPQNINAVMDKMPPLASPSGNVQAAANSTVLFSSKNNNQPLWLLQQANVPKALLLGEGLWRWRLYEYRFFSTHQTINEVIRQTVSFLAANVNENPFHTELPKYVWSDREPITLNAYLLNASNEQINTADVELIITDSAGVKQSYNFEKNGSAYKINIGTRAAGSYTYFAKTSYNGKSYTASGSFRVENMPLEMMETGADFPMLYTLSEKYNGAAIRYKNILSLYDSIKNNKAVQPVIRSSQESIPLIDWKWFFFLILLLAVAEWLLRKYWMAQ